MGRMRHSGQFRDDRPSRCLDGCRPPSWFLKVEILSADTFRRASARYRAKLRANRTIH